MRTRTKITLGIVGASFGLHLAAWAWMGAIRGERKHDTIAIALAESKKKEKEKEKPKPPPVEIKPEKAKVVAPAPKAIEPVPEQVAPPPDAKASNMNGFADLGLGSFSGGTGGGGLAVPSGGGGGGGGGGATTPTPTATQRHVALTPSSDCTEDLVKPKLEHQIQPAYTQEGRQANAEGAVQLEITVDATGHVVSVKVLHGLGFGLDEAAMSAARQWTFAPATRCGKAVPTVIKGKVRFSLS